ncbi:MAG: hypothetical protein ACFFD4_00675 [Candidatus Odinarchaeota archaeon]
MKKLHIAFLVVCLTIILLGTYAGTIILSVTSISASMDDPAFAYHITGNPVTGYDGYIEVSVPVVISNGGFYAIKNLQVDIEIHIVDMEYTDQLDGTKTGEGSNAIGDIAGGTTWSGMVTVNIQENIAVLAVQNGNLHVIVNIAVGYDIILVTVPYQTRVTADVPYTAPYHV